MSSVLLLNFEEFSPVYGPINFPINSLIPYTIISKPTL